MKFIYAVVVLTLAAAALAVLIKLLPEACVDLWSGREASRKHHRRDRRRMSR